MILFSLDLFAFHHCMTNSLKDLFGWNGRSPLLLMGVAGDFSMGMKPKFKNSNRIVLSSVIIMLLMTVLLILL